MKTQERNKPKYLLLTKKPKKLRNSWNGIPAFIKKHEPEISLLNHFFLSIFWHIIFILLLGLAFTIFKTSGANQVIKQKEKTQDIAFILNNSSNQGPKLRSSNSAAKTEKLNQNTNIETKNKSKQAKNLKKNSFASSPAALTDDFSIPVPKMNSASSALRSPGGGKTGASGNSSSGSSSSDFGLSDVSSGGFGTSKGSGFDKNAARQAVNTYDISPYVNELKRSIRMNWKPPKDADNKNVELFMRIAKDGRLIILNVKKTSEIAEADEAALNAIRKTLPLSPLPSKYAKSYLDLIFTFNSNTSSVGSKY